MALGTRPDVNVTIGGDTKKLDAALTNAQARLRSFATGALNIVKNLALIGAAAVAAGGAILTHLVKNSLDALDAQSKLARQIGSTVEAVQTLERAAELSGVPNLTKSAQMLTRALGEVQNSGAGPAKDALDRLGLTVDELTALDADDRLVAIAEAMDEMGLTAAQRLDVLRDFGIRGAEMATLLENGGAAIRQAAADVDRFGVSISQTDASAIERANDAMTNFGMVITGVSNQLTAALAPYLERISNILTDAAANTGGFRSQIEAFIPRAILGFGAFVDVLADVQYAFTRLMQVGAIFNRFVANTVRLQVELANFLTGGAMEGFATMVREAERSAQEAVRTLNADALTLRFRGSAEEWLAGFIADVQNAETQLADSAGAPERTGGGANDNNAPDDGSDLLAGQTREQLAARLEAFDDSLATEEEMAQRSFARRLAELQAFEDAGLLTTMEAAGRRMALEQEYEAALAQARDDGTAAKLEALDYEIMSERDRLESWYQEKQELLAAALEQGLISEADAAERSAAIEQAHMDKLTAIRERGMTDLQKFTAMSYRDQAATVLGELTAMTAGVAKQNKALFNINKIAGIADAIVNAHIGISRTLAAYPYPLNIGLAAAHAAAAFAQVQSIRSASFSGGGAAPALAGSTPAAPVTNVPASNAPSAPANAGGGSGQVIQINLVGDVFDRRSVLELIDKFNDAVADGARLRVA